MGRGRRLRTRFCAGLAALLCCACTDPGDRYRAFVERFESSRDAQVDEPDASDMVGDAANEGGTDEPPTCALPDPDEFTGTYVMSVSLALAPGRPIVTLIDTTASMEGDVWVLELSQQPLSAADRMTPVGERGEVQRFEFTDTDFETTPFDSFTPAEANPITGTDAEAVLILRGTLCSVRGDDNPDATVDSWCGTVGGEILRPLPMPLDGSTFAAVRVADAQSIPTDLPINCAGDLADPL